MADRVGLGAVAFGLAFTASYAAQRLATAWLGEPDPSVVYAQIHVPYYWRIGLASLHGVVVASIAVLGAREPAWWLDRAPGVVAVVVGVAVVAMFLVP